MSETNEKVPTEPVNLLPCNCPGPSHQPWCEVLKGAGISPHCEVSDRANTPNPASADVERIAKDVAANRRAETTERTLELSRMKSAIEWFKEKGFTFDDKVTIKDVIDLQNDARKDGLMTAIGLASEVIRAEATKYVPRSDLKLAHMPPEEMALNGLDYKVSSAILKSADALEYLKASNERLAT